MIFRALDSSNDWTFGGGNNNYLTDDSAIGANIQTRVLSWVGNCFFAIQAGIDWLNRLGTPGQKNLLESDLRRIILQSYGVTALLKIDILIQGRKFTATYTVQTIFSEEYIASVTREF